MEILEKAKAIVRILDEKKAIDLNLIKVSDITSVTDYMVFSTGGSTTQVKALADTVEEKMKEMGFPPLRIEGRNNSNWILVDFGDVVAHVFTKELREFYDLDHFWGDGEIVDITDIVKPNEGNFR